MLYNVYGKKTGLPFTWKLAENALPFLLVATNSYLKEDSFEGKRAAS